MKKTTFTSALAFIAVIGCMIGLLSFTIAMPPKPKQFILNEEQATKLFEAIEIAKSMIPRSTVGTPDQSSKAVLTFVEIQKILLEQAKAQTDTVKPINK